MPVVPAGKDVLTMSCPGLRHPSCGRGGSAATLAVTGIVALAAWWAFENPVAVIMTVAVSLVLSVAVVSLLARAMARREARMGRKLAAWRQAEFPEPRRERRAVAGDVHLRLHGLPDTEVAAAIIGRAITGPVGATVPSDAVAAQAVPVDTMAAQAVPVDAVAVGVGQHLPALPAGTGHEPAVSA
jgi:hypothetical protein